MTTSVHHPVPPIDANNWSDRARATIGTVIDETAAAAHDVTPPATNITRHVVQIATDGILALVPTGRLAHVRAFATRTAMRMKATSGWLPVWLAVSTVVGMYFVSEPITLVSTPVAPLVFVLLGLVAGLLLWVAAAAATSGDALPDRANSRSYGDLAGRMTDAESTIERRFAAGRLAQTAPIIELAVLKARLQAPPQDADWASGMGYVNAWRDLHRIEEALVDVADDSELDGVLRHDELRVEDSKLAHENCLVRQLIDDARKRLDADPGADVRSRLGAIRRAVDDFRDRRFEALVRNRMYVDRVSLLLGLAAWALLCLAILAGADKLTIAGVAALYLVGAAMGLFTQLRSGLDESLEDVFGYGQAQLRQTVLVSGLAGVAGVFLTAVLGTAAVADAADPTQMVSIQDALAFTPVTALTAAAFGLAPGMLVDRVSGWAKSNINDLESTTSAASGKGDQK